MVNNKSKIKKMDYKSNFIPLFQQEKYFLKSMPFFTIFRSGLNLTLHAKRLKRELGYP
jgi:hypothetical protein